MCLLWRSTPRHFRIHHHKFAPLHPGEPATGKQVIELQGTSMMARDTDAAKLELAMPCERPDAAGGPPLDAKPGAATRLVAVR
jgi:hypothetical protein